MVRAKKREGEESSRRAEFVGMAAARLGENEWRWFFANGTVEKVKIKIEDGKTS